jgi:hypothetical protein
MARRACYSSQDDEIDTTRGSREAAEVEPRGLSAWVGRAGRLRDAVKLPQEGVIMTRYAGTSVAPIRVERADEV